jgi:hypothetical protein
MDTFALNEEKFSLFVKQYSDALHQSDSKEMIGGTKERQEQIDYFQSFDSSKIQAFTEEELAAFIGHTWTGRSSKRYHPFGTIVEHNGGLEKLKDNLIDFLYGPGSFGERWDRFNAYGIGAGTKSELLGLTYPDDCAILNQRTKTALDALGIAFPDSNVSGDDYSRFCLSMKRLEKRLNEADVKTTNLLEVDYFLFEISYRYLKKESEPLKKESGKDCRSVREILETLSRFGGASYVSATERNSEKALAAQRAVNTFSSLVRDAVNRYNSTANLQLDIHGQARWTNMNGTEITKTIWLELTLLEQKPQFANRKKGRERWQPSECIAIFASQDRANPPSLMLCQEYLRKGSNDNASQHNKAAAMPLSEGLYVTKDRNGVDTVCTDVPVDANGLYDDLVRKMVEDIVRLMPFYLTALGKPTTEGKKPSENLTVSAGHSASFDLSQIDRNIHGRNEIYYGVPGCGKSYFLATKVAVDGKVFRTTFYQDYSYSDFVGQIMPQVDEDNGRPVYGFVPGPFTKAVLYALQHTKEKVFLIIEEVNRGNAPAIFGDIFQLLDRENGLSSYPIENSQIAGYLSKEGANLRGYLTAMGYANINEDTIAIPANLFILGTMNTSDQSVFALDNAFKRRFGFIRVSNIPQANDPVSKQYVPGTSMAWIDFLKKINQRIVATSDSPFEDKQLGLYFAHGILADASNSDDIELKKAFAMKVLEYLYDDVARSDRADWFVHPDNFDEIIDDFLTQGLAVFKFAL